jgi:hypothetical protein
MSQLYSTDLRINPLANKIVHRPKTQQATAGDREYCASASFIEKHMPRPTMTRPPAGVTYLFSALVHCPICDVLQPMHVKGTQPALYCGKDTIFYQCTKCGNETSKRVAAREEQ